MSEEIKRCPFCDSNGNINEYTAGYVAVRCMVCGAEGSQVSVKQANTERERLEKIKKAIELWNDRAERTCTYDSAEDYSLVCSACGWNRRGALIIPNYCPHCGARVENANEDELAETHHRFQGVETDDQVL